jgi:hypothetical protein
VATKPEDAMAATGAAPSGLTGGLAAPGGSIAGAMKSMTNTAFTPSFTTYTPGNDSVENRVASISASGSPLMKQAEQTGLNLANKRGMLNSSIAVGAAQGETLKAATPIATADAQIAAQKNLAAMDQTGQNERLTANAGFQSQLQREQGDIQGGLNAAQYDAQFKQLQTSLASDLQKLNMQIASAEGQQKLDLQQQAERLQTQGRQQLDQLAAQAGYTSQQMGQQFGYTTQLQQQQAKAALDQLNASSAAEMARLQTQLASAEGQQKLDIQAQMDRLKVDVQAESDRLGQAAGYDMSRLQAQGAIDIQRDILAAKNSQDLAKVQGEIQSKLQGEGNDQQIQRMNLELTNQLQLTDAQQKNDLAKIAASGDQDVRKLVEDANQQRITLAQSIAHDDRTALAQNITSIFQTENQLRAALLSNDKIPAAERAAYEATISNLGAPIRNYLNTLFGGGAPAAPASGATYTTEPVGTPAPYSGGLLGGGPPVTDTTGGGGVVSGGTASGGGGSGDINIGSFTQPAPAPQIVSPYAGGSSAFSAGGLLAPSAPQPDMNDFAQQQQQQQLLRQRNITDLR